MNREIPKFSLNFQMIESIDLNKMKSQFEPDSDDIENDYNPFEMKKFQYYQPLYKVFFNMDDTNYDSICLNHKYKMIDLKNVRNSEDNSIVNRDIFIKYSPMLNPLHYMVGKYDFEDETLKTLPNLTSTKSTKIESINNSSNVDCFFSFLSSVMLNHHNFVNCIDFYGSYLCVQDQAKVNVTDDYEYLCDSEVFTQKLNKEWKISKIDVINKMIDMNDSRSNKQCIEINEILDINEVLECENIENDEPLSECEKSEDAVKIDDLSNIELHEEFGECDEAVDIDVSQSDDSDSNVEETSDEESDSDEEFDSSSDDSLDIELFAYIKEFPVQMICLEKCDGTFDSLLENQSISEEESCSALMQIVMILLCLQKAFKFTHNDLHTNNIMYVNTDIEFIHYQYNKVIYKVPTYGKIFKLIDFGRAIYKFKNKIYCSDSFAPGGDAATQYNCEPFYNDKKPVIEPNMSFDLCRLGCSIYDFIIDKEEESEMTEFQKTINRWCLDDNDLNVLYKSSGSERYPNFKLYKMIARTVHNHTPENQLKYDYFKSFVIDDLVESEVNVVNIDEIPSYVHMQ